MTKILATILALLSISSVVFARPIYQVTKTNAPAYFRADSYGKPIYDVFRTVEIHQPNNDGNPQSITAWISLGQSSSSPLEEKYSAFVKRANAHIRDGGTFLLTRFKPRYADEYGMAQYSTLMVHDMFPRVKKSGSRSTPLP